MQRLYSIWQFLLEEILGRLAAVAFLVAVLIAIVEVFRRYVLGTSWLWQQDVVVMLTLSGVFIYYGITQLQRRHIAMMVLNSLFTRIGGIGITIRRVVGIGALLAFLAMALIFSYWGVHETRALLALGTRSSSLTVPMWPLVGLLTMGFALLSVTIWLQVVRAVTGVDEGHQGDELAEVVVLLKQDPVLSRFDVADTDTHSDDGRGAVPPGSR